MERAYERARRIHAVYDFQKGMVTGLSPGAVPPDAALWAINTDAARGGLRVRRGRQRVGNRLPAASSTCYWIGQYRRRSDAGTFTLQTLRINSTDLFELVGDVWVHRGSVSSRGLVQGRQFANRLWLSDGIVPGVVWDGTTVEPWGFGAPDIAPLYLAENGAGGYLYDGADYSFAYTFYSSSTFEETDPSETVSHTVATGTNTSRVFIRVPAQVGIPARFDKVRLYRTEQDGATLYYEQEADWSGAAVDVWMGTREDSNLSTPLAYDNDPPPKLDWFVIFESRFFGSGPLEPSTLVWSKTDQPWAWPALNALNVLLDDGDKITGGFVMHGRLFVFKRRSAHVVTADPVFDYSLSQLPADIGCVSQWSLVVVGNYGYGFDDRGIWRFNGAQFERLTSNVIDFFLDARRNVQSLEAYATHDARPDRPYYRLVLDGPDPRDDTTRTWWVSLFEPSGGISLLQGWDATVVATIEGTEATKVPEVWSGDTLGAVYRHFEDVDGNPLYADEDEDGIKQDIEYDYRTADLVLGQDDQPSPPWEARATTGMFIEWDRSAGTPPLATAYTSILDGIESDQKDFPGFGAGPITRATYWRQIGTPARRHGVRIHGTGTYDWRMTGFALEYVDEGLRLRGTR